MLIFHVLFLFYLVLKLFQFLQLLRLSLIFVNQPFLLISSVPGLIFQLVSFPLLVALNVLGPDILSLLDILGLKPLLIIVRLHVLNLLHSVLVEGLFDRIGLIGLGLH